MRDVVELPDPGPLAEAYAIAEPFRHVVIDGFLPDDLVAAIADEFPAVDEMERHHNDAMQIKSGSSDESRWGEPTRQVIRDLDGPTVIGWLESVTGIAGLVSDPEHIGGGLHQIRRGGKLGVHADFNRHPTTGFARRLNLLVYLNPGWDDAWGGHLELWNKTMTACVHRVAPVAGRAVLFGTDSDAFHGHPEPLQSPDGVTRKSLALYYYSPPPRDLAAHSTLFQVRPGSSDQTVLQSEDSAHSSWLSRLRNASLHPLQTARWLGSDRRPGD